MNGWGTYEDKESSTTPSEIVQMCHSPKHYHSSYILKEFEQTKSMVEGSILHEYLLEPEKFNSKYAFRPTGLGDCLDTADDLKTRLKELGAKVSGTKAELIERLQQADPSARILSVELEKACGGKIIIEEKLERTLKRIRQECEESEIVSQLLFKDGENEKTGYFTHSMTGVVVRFRADRIVRLPNGKRVVIDVKRVDKTNKRQFESYLFDAKLHVLAALYVDAIKAIDGDDVIFAWIACQPKPPYLVSCYAADFGALEAGRVEAFHAINKWKECKETNQWPAPNSGIVNVTLPSWGWTQIEGDDNE